MESKDKIKKLDQRTDLIYVQWPGKTEADFIYEICQLGKFSYKKIIINETQFYHQPTFTKLQGWMIMEKIINENRMDILEASKIISDKGKVYTWEKFLNGLEKVQVK